MNEKNNQKNVEKLTQDIQVFCDTTGLEVDVNYLIDKIRAVVHESFKISAYRQINGFLQFELSENRKIQIFILKI